MATVFSRILAGELPGTFVHRDDVCAVLLSINPLAPGHALVIPVDEIDHWVDISAELSAHLFDVARRVGDAQRRAFTCERVGLIIAGYEVPHAHIHVIPTSGMHQLDFRNAAASVSRDDLDAWAAAIRDQMAS
jgi:diadenosine tetraphosphate (Ap4A) HIT family hydrolase